MRKELRDKQKVAYTIIYLLMVFSLSNVLSTILAVELNIIGRFFITVLIGLIIQLFVFIPMTLLPVFGILTGTVLIFNRFNQEALLRVFSWLDQFYRNIMNHLQGTEQILLVNSRMLWIILIALISVYTVIILFKTKHNYLLLPVYILIFIYYWYSYVDISYFMMGLFLMLYIILWGYDGFFNAQKGWRKKGANYSQKIYPYWFKTAIGYGLIIVILAAILPKRGPIVDWDWLEKKIQDQFPFLVDLRDDLVYSRSYSQARAFNFSKTGFQPDSHQLGGPVKLNDKLVMKVEAPYPLYLRGNVKNMYDRNRWEEGISIKKTQSTLKGLPLEVDLGSRITVKITYENIATPTVFTPYQMIRLINSDINKLTYDEDYQITLQGAKYKDEGYELRAMIPSRLVTFDEEEDLDEYDDYLQLPYDLSESIYQLGNEITKEADTPYEKAVLIRDYLRENYTYTLEPSHIPPGEEFVEYFLMKEKEGYCTYFATAMAVLLRTQGVPSRYVEGYKMPSEQVDGIYEIRQYNAHAWVEAYVGEGSWITFEATPAFDMANYQDIEISSSEVSDSRKPLLEDMDPSNLDGRADSEIMRDIIGGDFFDDGDGLTPKRTGSTLSATWDILSKILSFALLLLLLVFIPLRSIYIHLKIKKYQKDLRLSKGSSKILYLYQNILKLLEELDYGIQPGETAYEFSKRVTFWVYGVKDDFRSLTDFYVKAKYGQIQMSEEEIESAFEFLNFLNKKVKNKKGLMRYFFMKYVQGKLIHCYNVSDETIPYL